MKHEARDAISGIGLTRDSEEFRTSSHRLAQFARSVDDTNPAHLSGTIASPVFSHVPVMQSMVEVLSRVTDGFALHGEQDFIFHTPIVPGMRLFTHSTLVGVRPTRAGTTYVIRSRTATHDHKPVVTQFATCLVRGETTAGTLGDGPPERVAVAGGAPSSETYSLAPDQTRRYADAARDYSSYTIDPKAAAKVGYPAPLVHGMCTLAFAARSIVDGHCGGDVRRLKRLACRFAGPLLLQPGQTITVQRWGGANGLVGFEATDSAGSLVVKNGYAETTA